jgi:flagellar motor protein MotB
MNVMKYLFTEFGTGYEVLLTAPRWLVPLGMLAAVAVLDGCVPAVNYEEATSAAEVQGEARRRAELELEQAKAKIRELEAEIRKNESGLEAEKQHLAEERFEHGVLAKERDEAATLLEQLRGDLARANENLKSYAADKARLEGELSKSRSAGQPASVGALAQALEIALATAHLSDLASVRPSKDAVTVRVDAKGVFASGSSSFRREFSSVFEASQRLLTEGGVVRGELREGREDSSVPLALGRERRDRLVRALEERKLAERIAYRPADNAASGPGSYEVVLRLEAAE